MKCEKDDCGLDVPENHVNFENRKTSTLDILILLEAIRWALSDQTLTKGTREELEKAIAQVEGK